MIWPASSRISWLMPLAPREDPSLLNTTLQCLRNQTLKAHELVIAADGPLPESLIRVIKASALPWRLIPQSRQQGIGATLAQAAPLCLGEVIVRIDSDDLYAAGHTAGVVEALLSDSRIGAIGCQLLELDIEQGWQHSARRTPVKAADARRWLAWRNPLNHQTVAMRYQALMDAGGYRHCPGFEDWDLWLRMAGAGYDLRNLPACTAAARVNRNHRRRRRGLQYIRQECRFYGRQIREQRINPLLASVACLCRIPWRLMPAQMFQWWMQSGFRGSPTLDTAWITQLPEDRSR
jgi:hypothetical protein